MSKADNAKASEEERVIYYTCPMEEHKHIQARAPGSCTECGMDLVASVITNEGSMDARANVRTEAAGNCGGCCSQPKPTHVKKG